MIAYRRLGSPQYLSLKGHFPALTKLCASCPRISRRPGLTISSFSDIRNCVDCPWIEDFIRTEGDTVFYLLNVVNCSLRNASFLEQPTLLRTGLYRDNHIRVNLSSNYIESVNIVQREALYIGAPYDSQGFLDLRNNPLKRLRVVRPVLEGTENLNYDILELYFDGVSESLEIFRVSLSVSKQLCVTLRPLVLCRTDCFAGNWVSLAKSGDPIARFRPSYPVPHSTLRRLS